MNTPSINLAGNAQRVVILAGAALTASIAGVIVAAAVPALLAMPVAQMIIYIAVVMIVMEQLHDLCMRHGWA